MLTTTAFLWNQTMSIVKRTSISYTGIATHTPKLSPSQCRGLLLDVFRCYGMFSKVFGCIPADVSSASSGARVLQACADMRSMKHSSLFKFTPQFWRSAFVHGAIKKTTGHTPICAQEPPQTSRTSGSDTLPVWREREGALVSSVPSKNGHISWLPAIQISAFRTEACLCGESFA